MNKIFVGIFYIVGVIILKLYFTKNSSNENSNAMFLAFWLSFTICPFIINGLTEFYFSRNLKKAFTISTILLPAAFFTWSGFFLSKALNIQAGARVPIVFCITFIVVFLLKEINKKELKDYNWGWCLLMSLVVCLGLICGLLLAQPTYSMFQSIISY